MDKPKFVTLGQSETWLVWRVLGTFDDAPYERLVIPRSDPHEYEYPLDGLFETVDEAVKNLEMHGVPREEAETLILCRETVTPLPDAEQPDLFCLGGDEDIEE